MGSGMQLIGSRYSPDTQRLREFAARPAGLFVDRPRQRPCRAALLRTLGLELRDTPVVVLGGSAVLVNPSSGEFATAAGIAEDPVPGSVFDLLVIGAGPACWGRGVRSDQGLSTAVIDALAVGGQASTTSASRTTSGSPPACRAPSSASAPSCRRSGWERRCRAHAAVSLSHSEGYYHVRLDNGAELLGKAVIVATGVTYRGLDVAGIERFEGLGVFYSPVDAGKVEAGEPVVIVGGGNSAGQAATALAASGHRVFVLVRGDGLAQTMSTYLLDRIEHDTRSPCTPARWWLRYTVTASSTRS